jgi:hypothetical protein
MTHDSSENAHENKDVECVFKKYNVLDGLNHFWYFAFSKKNKFNKQKKILMTR